MANFPESNGFHLIEIFLKSQGTSIVINNLDNLTGFFDTLVDYLLDNESDSNSFDDFMETVSEPGDDEESDIVFLINDSY